MNQMARGAGLEDKSADRTFRDRNLASGLASPPYTFGPTSLCWRMTVAKPCGIRSPTLAARHLPGKCGPTATFSLAWPRA